jgi:hypothetical protein
MNNTTTHHLKYHFLAIFATFTPSLSINGINTPIRHDPTNLTPFRANMSEIRRKGAETDSLLRMVLIKLLRLSLICYILLYISCYILDVIFWVIFLTLQNYFYDDKTNIYKKSIDFYISSVINSNSYLEIKKVI